MKKNRLRSSAGAVASTDSKASRARSSLEPPYLATNCCRYATHRSREYGNLNICVPRSYTLRAKQRMPVSQPPLL